MPNPIIKVNNLSKCYRIGVQGDRWRYKTLRETIMDGITAPIRNFAKLQNLTKFGTSDDEKDVIWALKDVSFEVNEGEVLGIIGNNGVGKSTLLKILSRITEPTEGFAELRGSVSSLLEIGVGFHPELTGRENIFLNGAILGMRKREIEERFDDIVAFAEIEKFINTPIKRYSSGMWVRLAFAIAAHLETEILLVDEVLAYGDIAFQKKCLGKMGDIAKGGRTVLFISHNMEAIRNLCKRAIWLDKGRIVKRGAVDEVVRDYRDNQIKRFAGSSYIVERNLEDVNNKSFYFSHVEMLNTAGEHTNIFRYNERLVLLVDLVGYPATRAYNVEFRIHNELEQFVSIGSSAFHGLLLNKNTKRLRIEIGPLILTSGRYTISLSAVDSVTGIRYDDWVRCGAFDIVECSPFGFGHEIPTNREGVCVLQQSFRQVE